MMAYAFLNVNQEGYEEVNKEEFDNILNLFASVLCKGIGRQIKQGLYRDYVGVSDNISMLKGKIDISETIKNRLSKNPLIACEYDELSDNNLLNKILKTTVLILLRNSDVKYEYKETFKSELMYFSEVEQIVDIKTINWSSVRFQRNNQQYRMLIGICQLIIDGMLLTTEEGEYRVATFLDDQRMCRLYEKFILEYYKRHFPELKPKSSAISWQLDSAEKSELLPAMQSDVMLTFGDRKLIIDGKYYSKSVQKQYGKSTLHSANIYQIFTYVKNEDIGNTGNVSGLLLYAKTEEEITPDMESVMSGNLICAKTLDLNCEFPNLMKQLDNIVSSFFIDFKNDFH